MFSSIAAILPPIISIIEKAIPDQRIASETKLKILELEQQSELDAEKTQLSAIIAEANSQDKWTSRARPAFLYVIYIMILSSIPLGIVNVIAPTTAHNFIVGVQLWLGAFPQPAWQLFGMGYLGYGAFRSYDKKQLVNS